MHESWLQLGCNGYRFKHIKYIENHKIALKLKASQCKVVCNKNCNSYFIDVMCGLP
jgi:hypothetical protein